MLSIVQVLFPFHCKLSFLKTFPFSDLQQTVSSLAGLQNLHHLAFWTFFFFCNEILCSRCICFIDISLWFHTSDQMTPKNKEALEFRPPPSRVQIVGISIFNLILVPNLEISKPRPLNTNNFLPIIKHSACSFFCKALLSLTRVSSGSVN